MELVTVKLKLVVLCVTIFIRLGDTHIQGNSETPQSKLIYVAKSQGGGLVVYRFSDMMVHDGDWHQVTSGNSAAGDVSYFEGHAHPYRAHKEGGFWFIGGEEKGGFEDKINICSITNNAGGQSVEAFLVTRKPCNSFGPSASQTTDLYVSLKEPWKQNVKRLHYAVCERGGVYVGRVATSPVLCGPMQTVEQGSFFVTRSGITCDFLPGLEHGFSTGTQMEFGEIRKAMSFGCDNGYNLVGAKKITCNGGRWSPQQPTCQVVTCAAPPSIPHGKPSGSAPWNYNKHASYQCDSGYELDNGGSTVWCMDNGQWSSTAPECQPVDCGFPGEIPNGDVHGDRYTFQSQVTFSCDHGYYKEGASTAKCTAQGRWDNRTPTCHKIRCPPLSTLPHGQRIGSDISLDSEIIFQCNQGYNLVGNATLKCVGRGGRDAVWSHGMPQCQVIRCKDPADPENGHLLGSDFIYGSTASFQCKPGYVLQGSSVLTCLENGWDTAPPTCTVVECTEPGIPAHGQRIGSSFTYGQVVKYECDEGYRLSGASALMCTETGRWNRNTPTCEPVECQPMATPEHGSVDWDSYEVGHKVLFSCFPGYSLTGNNKTQCQTNGQWSDPPPTCTACPVDTYKDGANAGECTPCPAHSHTATEASFSSQQCQCHADAHGPLGGPCTLIQCEVLTAPQFGSISQCGQDFGQECEFSCKAGYYIQGTRLRRCTKDGWTGVPATCSPCAANTYKEEEGTLACTPCPAQTMTHPGEGISRDSCRCAPGYQGPPGGPCTDVDECSTDNGGCNHACDNFPGGYQCRCTIPGYELHSDEKTCIMTRTCDVQNKTVNHGRLNCRYTAQENGYICYIRCDKGYFFVSGVNNYVTCGSDTEFRWSHQLINATKRIPACTREFFVDILLPSTAKYSAASQCQGLDITAGAARTTLEGIVTRPSVCSDDCDVSRAAIDCSDRGDNATADLTVNFELLVKNSNRSAVSKDCDSRCKQQNMRGMLRKAFGVKQAIESTVNADSQILIPPNSQITLTSFRHLRPQILCDPGRVLTRYRLCVPCDAGYYLPNRTLTTCLPCPKGTYQDQQEQTECKPCLAGSTTVTTGSDHPVMCNVKEIRVNVDTAVKYDEAEEEASNIVDEDNVTEDTLDEFV